MFEVNQPRGDQGSEGRGCRTGHGVRPGAGWATSCAGRQSRHSAAGSALRGAERRARVACRARSTCGAVSGDRVRVTTPQPSHGLRAGTLHRRQRLHLYQHRLRDVQRRAAGDGGAAGVGPQHVHVVPLPVRGAVPRVRRLRAQRRSVAGRARLLGGRRARGALREVAARVHVRRGVPGGERGVLRRVDGRVAGGVVDRGAAGRAGAQGPRPRARPQAGAARRRAVPRRGAAHLRDDRGGGARGAQQRVRHRRVRRAGHDPAGGCVRDGVSAGPTRGPRRPGPRRAPRVRRAPRRRRQRRARRPRRPRVAQDRQPAHVHHPRQNFLAGRNVGGRRVRGGDATPAARGGRDAPTPSGARAQGGGGAEPRRGVGGGARAVRGHEARLARALRAARRRPAHPARRHVVPEPVSAFGSF